MGSYWSKKDEKKESRDGPEEEKKKSRFKVVYLDREVKISELPGDVQSIFVLRRRG